MSTVSSFENFVKPTPLSHQQQFNCFSFHFPPTNKSRTRTIKESQPFTFSPFLFFLVLGWGGRERTSEESLGNDHHRQLRRLCFEDLLEWAFNLSMYISSAFGHMAVDSSLLPPRCFLYDFWAESYHTQ